MRRGLLVALVVLLPLGPVWSAQEAPSLLTPSPLGETDRLRADNLKLRAQVLELQRALAQLQLETEAARLQVDRQALEATFRALLKPKAGDVFDWQTLTFTPPPPPAATNGTP